MAAELMNSKLVHLSVRLSVAIISEPKTRISFKFWLLLPLGRTPREFFMFWKKILGGIFSSAWLYQQS